MPTMAPRYAYATLFDWVNFRARVATMRSVSACDGSCAFSRIREAGGAARAVRTYLLVLRHNVLEQLRVDLRVVAFLLHENAVYRPDLDVCWFIGRVDLRTRMMQKSIMMLRYQHTWSTQYFPPFFLPRTSRASGEYPGAIIPSETSREMIRAVARSHGAESAMKSPKEDILSAPVRLGG